MRGRSRSAGPGEIACGEEHSRSIVLEVPEHVPKRLTSARVHRAFIARSSRVPVRSWVPAIVGTRALTWHSCT